jgi:Xaa-Pro dipeptidase
MRDVGLEKLREIATKAGLDALVLLPGYNLQYLTGVKFHLLERPFMVFFAMTGEDVAALPGLEAQQFIDTGFDGQVFAWQDADGYQGAFEQAFAALKLSTGQIGVEGLTMRFRDAEIIRHYLPDATIIDADEALVALRVQKSVEEIDNHRRAVEISEKALAALLDELKLGMTEHAAAQRLSQLQQEFGGAGDSFTPTVLFGARSALPHGEPGDTPLQAGDTVLIDFGTRHKGYVSDISRTFFAGHPGDEMLKLYDAVLAANEAGRAAARAGITGAELDDTTTQVLIAHGYPEYVVHRTGHGIGLDIHEHPNISAENTEPLQPGMAFTIEPGLYVPGVGGVRIEDNVVINSDGTAESLSTFPREQTILKLS